MFNWSLAKNLKKKAGNFQSGGYLKALGEVALAVHMRGNILNSFEMRQTDEKLFSLVKKHDLLLNKARIHFKMYNNIQI